MKTETCFTAIIKETKDGWFIGQIEEIPEAMSQGKSLEELMENLSDALNMVLEMRREETIKQYHGEKYFTRRLAIV